MLAFNRRQRQTFFNPKTRMFVPRKKKIAKPTRKPQNMSNQDI